MRYHYIPIRMARRKSSDTTKRWPECRENGSFIHCCWECKMVEPLWETVWQFLQNETCNCHTALQLHPWTFILEE